LGKCQIIVRDGINMGHPCCGIFQCTTVLENNQHHFCLTHDSFHCVCAITGCLLPVVIGTKTCTMPAHQQMETLNKA
ncbi:hypothetical protein L208DRAFT_1236317, partial [Tricholoma matsutake]